jgi:ankyrin repeat protein
MLSNAQWFYTASSRIKRECVTPNLGHTLLGEANQRLLEDDVEGIEKTLAEDGPEKMGVMLVFACVHGARRCAKHLVKQGAMQDVDMTICGDSPCLFSPITVAALLGHWEVVEVLVEWGADPYAFDGWGFSALLVATHKHPEGCLEYLLRLKEARRHIYIANDHGLSPLHVGSASAGPLLLGDVEVDDLDRSEYARFMLLRACISGQLDELKAMVERARADAVHVGPGEPAAANEGHGDIVEYLGSVGIDIDARSENQERFLDIACSSGHLEVVKLLVKAGARVEAQAGKALGELALAASKGRVEVVKYLVEEAGANVHLKNSKGMTLVMGAAEGGHAELMAYLLGRPGIDIEAKSEEGSTALDLACRRGHLEVVKLLVAAGGDLRRQGGEECGVLAWAAMGGNLDVVKYLVEEAGADERHIGPRGMTTLMWAIEQGDVGVVRYLVGRPSTDLDARDDLGQSAIKFACRNGHLEIVKLLVAAGVEISPNSNQWGILADAVAGGKLDVVKYLLEEAGADERGLKPDGATLLILAANCRDAEVAVYLQQAASQRKDEVSMPCALVNTMLVYDHGLTS